MTTQTSLFEELAPAPAPPVIEIPNLLDYDWIVINSSAGKDSQAMLDYVCGLAEEAGLLDRVVVVHADLGRVEWKGTKELAAEQAARYGVRFVVVWRGQGDLLEQVESRGMWPSPAQRYCTAHHKANQVDRLITELATETTQPDPKDLLSRIEERGKWPDASNRYCTSDFKRAQVDRLFTVLSEKRKEAVKDAADAPVTKYVPRILNCMGMRAQESPARAKKPVLDRGDVLRPNRKGEMVFGRGTSGNRVIDHWLPLHAWKVQEVWDRIGDCRTADLIHYAYGLGMKRLSCVFCLAGDTEVVTRLGIKEIRELAGTTSSLLIPKVSPYGISGIGSFKNVEVHSFGVQELLQITMHRNRQRKVVYATPEHRWLVWQKKPKTRSVTCRGGYETTTLEVTTSTLLPGMTIRSMKSESLVKTGMPPVIVPFAVAQGFVYGDGAKGYGDRPATLEIYDIEKDAAMLPFFPNHAIQVQVKQGRHHIYGLPRLWKEAPDFRESRSFLVSWLSGYFAADGCVSELGQATISSAKLESVQLVRSVAAICGIGYGPISKVEGVGTGRYATALYKVNLSIQDLPEWFFVIESHRQRISARADVRQDQERQWIVDSVEHTGRTEEVFCAVVPGAHAFALSDEIMTGNCIFADRGSLVLAGRHNPELLNEYVRVEEKIGHRFKDKLTIAEVQRLVESGEDVGEPTDFIMA